VGKVRYSQTSIADLEQIGDYIALTLKNPTAALNTLDKIQNKIEKLKDSPLLGTPLSSHIEKETDYRFLICGNYLVFYRPQENNVYIDRVMYSKRDYIAVLFGNLSQTGDNDSDER